MSHDATNYKGTCDRLEEEINELVRWIKSNREADDSATGLSARSFWRTTEDMIRIRWNGVKFVATFVGYQPAAQEATGSPAGLVELIPSRVRFVAEVRTSNALETGNRVALDPGTMAVDRALPDFDHNLIMSANDMPEVRFADVGGYEEQCRSLREIFLLQRDYAAVGIKPPKTCLIHGPPGTGKTFMAKAVANESGVSFINVNSTALVKKYVGQGAQLVRQIFNVASSRAPRSCLIFFDDIDVIGDCRNSRSSTASREVERTMLELIVCLDGFDSVDNIKVIMATSRYESLDPALRRPGRIDRTIQLDLPNHHDRVQILKALTRRMPLSGPLRWDLLASLSQGFVAADLERMRNEAGFSAIKSKRSRARESDFLEAITLIRDECRQLATHSCSYI